MLTRNTLYRSSYEPMYVSLESTSSSTLLDLFNIGY